MMGNYSVNPQCIWRQTSTFPQTERCAWWWIILTQWSDIHLLTAVQMNQPEVSITSKHTFSFFQGIEITSTGSSNHYVTGTAVEVRTLSFVFPFFHRWLTDNTELTITDSSGLITIPLRSSVTETSAPLQLQNRTSTTVCVFGRGLQRVTVFRLSVSVLSDVSESSR